MAGAGRRRHRSRRPPGHSHRRVRRHEQQRLPAPDSRCAGEYRGGRRPLLRHGKLAEPRHRPRVLRARLRRPGDGRGHRLFVLAGRRAPGGRRPASGRCRPRPGGWRPGHPVRSLECPAREGRDALAQRPVQDLRRSGRRLRARRRLRHRGVEATRRGRGGRRPDLGGDPRFGGEPGRHGAGTHGAGRAGPAARHRSRVGQRRARAFRGRLPRGPRHGYAGGRSHRTRRGSSGVRQGSANGSAAAHRLGQDQHRPPGVRRRGRGADQGDLGAEARRHSQAPALRGAEPDDRGTGVAPQGHCGSDGVADGRPAVSGGRELVRFFRHKRPRRARVLRHTRDRGTGRDSLRRGGVPAGPTAGNLPAAGTEASHPPSAPVRQVGGRTARPVRSPSAVAGRTRGRFGHRVVRRRSAAFRSGLDRQRRPQSLPPPRRRRVRRHRDAARRTRRHRRRGRRAGPLARPRKSDRGVRLHRPGEPVGRHGAEHLRDRTRGEGRPRPLRRVAWRVARCLATGRHVRRGGRGLVGRPGLDPAIDLRAGVCPDRAVGEPGRATGRGRGSQPGRDRRRPGRRRVHPGRGPGIRGPARRPDRGAAGERRHGRGVGPRVGGRRRGGGTQRRL